MCITNYGGNSSIINNTLTGCLVGVYILGGTPIVAGNLIVNCTGDKINGFGGIRIDYQATVPVITNNTIAENPVGINLLNSPNPTIKLNNIISNKEYSIYLYASPSATTNAINATNNW